MGKPKTKPSLTDCKPAESPDSSVTETFDDFVGTALDHIAETMADTLLALENDDLRAKVAELEAAEQRHLRLIARLSTDSISPDEATEMRGQIASLIAEVGTLRSALRGKDGE